MTRHIRKREVGVARVPILPAVMAAFAVVMAGSHSANTDVVKGVRTPAGTSMEIEIDPLSGSFRPLATADPASRLRVTNVRFIDPRTGADRQSVIPGKGGSLTGTKDGSLSNRDLSPSADGGCEASVAIKADVEGRPRAPAELSGIFRLQWQKDGNLTATYTGLPVSTRFKFDSGEIGRSSC